MRSRLNLKHETEKKNNRMQGERTKGNGREETFPDKRKNE